MSYRFIGAWARAQIVVGVLLIVGGFVAAGVDPSLGSRAALDPLHYIDHLGPRGMAGGEAGASARPGDAQADRAGGLVELDSRGREGGRRDSPAHESQRLSRPRVPELQRLHRWHHPAWTGVELITVAGPTGPCLIWSGCGTSLRNESASIVPASGVVRGTVDRQP